jgi:squalene-hopene/tetraprenyl-beta-curcumene cyclase
LSRARRFALHGLGLLLLAGCSRGPAPLKERLDRSLARAVQFLVAAQSEDGAWRSRAYGTMAEGLSLTPVALKTLLYGLPSGEADAAARKGLAWLAGRPAAAAGPFPVYTASLAAIVLTRAGADAAARDAWLDLLRRHQLVEEQGWTPGDLSYGGWSYSVSPPRRGDPRACEADLSSTTFALGALRFCGAPRDDPAVRRALRFVERCQNLGGGDPAIDDGGFFFSPADELPNKAGVARDHSGRGRFRSYGTMTADGARALLRCGLPPSHERALAARAWLERRFAAARPPGDFDPAREGERMGAFFYWCWSAAHAFRALDAGAGAGRAWAVELAEELLRRQRADGSWRNDSGWVKEDDPLVATPLAAGALGVCRLFL